jgi:hypothetical protein
MNDPNKPGPEEQFEKAWRTWLEKPIRPLPGPGWLNGELRRKNRGRQRFWLPLAAAAAFVLLFAVFIERDSTHPENAETIVESPTLGQGEVLIWLDEKTPLYMTFQTQ